MKLMIIGDTHREPIGLAEKIKVAGDLKIQHVLVVGDFGLWDHDALGVEFLDRVQDAAEINSLSVYAIPGNHENHDHWEWYVANMPTHKGFAMVRRRVLLAPKFHHWKWDHKQFVSAGGAVSIDKDYRLGVESGNYMDFSGRVRRQGTGFRTMWWPNEELTDQDVVRIEKSGLKADYLFTHDCSTYTPFRGRLKPDADSDRHRRRIDNVLRATQPNMHFHGHMHTKYEWVNGLVHGTSAFDTSETTGPETLTYGLECNDDWNAWGVLDTEKNAFAFRGKFD